MEWEDEGFILDKQPHGESAVIMHVLTENNGRHAGLVHGGQGNRKASTLQTGNRVRVRWQARLSEHLGTFDVEPISSPLGHIIDSPGRLAALQSATSLIQLALPEREPHPGLFHSLATLIEMLSGEAWAPAYVFWEFHFLKNLGFSMDLSSCAVTGEVGQLGYVSPRTGRAVSEAGAGIYKEKLLRLPPFLTGGSFEGEQDIVDGLKLTGHFLERYVTSHYQVPLPPARLRLLEICRAPGRIC